MSEQNAQAEPPSDNIIQAARRVGLLFAGGYDRCDGDDLTLLESAGLMRSGVCDDNFGQDTLEVGETMWTFTAAGNALLKSLDIEP